MKLIVTGASRLY